LKEKGRKFFLHGAESLEQGAKIIFVKAPRPLPPAWLHFLPGPFSKKKGGVIMRR